MSRLGQAILAIVLVLNSVTHAQAQEVVARILETVGSAVVEDTKGNQRPAMTYGGLFADEALKLAGDATITLMWKTDHRVEKLSATKNGTVVKVLAERLEPGDQVQVVDAPKRPNAANLGKIAAALPDISPGGGIVPRSSEDEPIYPRIQPATGTVLTSTNIVFTWPATEGATSYYLQILVRDEQDPIVDQKIKEPTFTLGKDVELEPGLDYIWSVSSQDAAGKPVKVQGEFRIASLSEAKDFTEILEWETELLKAKETAVLTAIANFYDRKHYDSNAVALYENLARLQPKQAEHWAALAELYQRAGRSRDAAKSRAAAMELGYQFKNKTE